MMKPATTSDVFDLIDAYGTVAALGAAMELGLFWLVAEQPLEASDVAQRLEIPLNRCQYWLQLLSSVDLLDRGPNGFSPSSLTQETILNTYSQETWAFLAREARERFPAVQDLALHIRTPGSVWDTRGLTPPDYLQQMIESPERARQFTWMLYEIHLPFADAIADSLDMRGVDNLMDLGGGSGVVSFALLRRNPGLRAVVVDIPNVCATGREIARENAMQDRIEYLEADFVRDELPTGFDRVLLCDVGPYSKPFFQKIRGSLNSGGRLVIVGQFAPKKGEAPASRLQWAFVGSLENPDTAYTTMTELRSWLIQAGYQSVSERALPSRGVEKWSGGWTIVKADN
jgi:SAM-dependent methyltransferase